MKINLGDLWNKYRNFILYCLIGVVNTGVDFGVFTLLRWFGLHYLVANLISYHCGIVCSFFLNKYYNFKVYDKSARRFLSFYMISLIAVGVSEGLLYLLIQVLSLNDLLAKLISMVIIAVGQFLFVKKFTFKK
ncbi:MAG: GtrA family protein [Bacteroidales bacterium]|nr:GtrA family protein [Bacteroidales bacterium]MBO7646889.1 GtrA family protein [Bacteroidales bacterium]